MFEVQTKRGLSFACRFMPRLPKRPRLSFPRAGNCFSGRVPGNWSESENRPVRLPNHHSASPGPLCAGRGFHHNSALHSNGSRVQGVNLFGDCSPAISECCSQACLRHPNAASVAHPRSPHCGTNILVFPAPEAHPNSRSVRPMSDHQANPTLLARCGAETTTRDAMVIGCCPLPAVHYELPDTLLR